MSDQKQEPAAPQAAPVVKGGMIAAVESKTAKIERAVEEWVSNHLRNSPLSRATEAWNHLQSKLKDLVSTIEKEV